MAVSSEQSMAKAAVRPEMLEIREAMKMMIFIVMLFGDGANIGPILGEIPKVSHIT